jgi:lambda family phage minor tail protein L
MPTPAITATASRRLVPGYGALIDLFICDASNIISSITGLPGPVFAFHNNSAYSDVSLFFQTVEYQPFPFEASGYEINPSSQLPRPRITASNIGTTVYVGAVLSAVLREFDDLYGTKLVHKRTFESFLDGKPGADPIQEFEPQIYYVDRKVSEMKKRIVLELGAPWDIEGVKIPGRSLNASACANVYRSGDGCDYTGVPVTDQYGKMIGPTFTGTFGAGSAVVTGLTGAALTNADIGLPVSGSKILAGTMVKSVQSTTSMTMTINAISGGSATMVLNRTRDRGAWSAATSNYILYDSVYVLLNNIRTYYVAKSAVGVGLYPRFNPQVWTGDVCNKQLTGGCRVRFGRNAVLPANLHPALGRAPQA